LYHSTFSKFFTTTLVEYLLFFLTIFFHLQISQIFNQISFYFLFSCLIFIISSILFQFIHNKLHTIVTTTNHISILTTNRPDIHHKLHHSNFPNLFKVPVSSCLVIKFDFIFILGITILKIIFIQISSLSN
jgi:hypothetical protein